MATVTVQYPRCDSAASVVVKYSSLSIGMKPESRESESNSLIWLITAQMFGIPPEH